MNLKKQFIPEIIVLRGLSAIAVVLMHSINRYNNKYYLPEIEKLLLFATPIFLFISSFLLFYTYQGKSNISISNFLKQRLQYIVLPYLIWSVIYSIIYHVKYQDSLPSLYKIIENIVTGQFHIYFILIVLQFYLLFILVVHLKLCEKILNMHTLFILFLFNFAYLYFFHYTKSPITSLEFLWDRMYYLLFTAWIFYFVLGGYFAIHLKNIKESIVKYNWWSILVMIFAGIFVLVLLDRPISSKRPEILVYTTLIIPFLFYISTFLIKGKVYTFLSFISRYSFGLYLTHPLFYVISYEFFTKSHPWIFFIIIFTIQFSGGLFISYVIGQFLWGNYIIGKLQKSPNDKQSPYLKHKQVNSGSYNVEYRY